MEAEIADLLNLLELEQLEVNLFRGESRDIGSPQVFGGQVLGQALTAASATVAGRVVHSLHAYFLRRGDFNAPIVYQVDRSLDGHSFANRRVVAIQHGEQIFNMAASFQVVEEGLDHQVEMPRCRRPRASPTRRACRPRSAGICPSGCASFLRSRGRLCSAWCNPERATSADARRSGSRRWASCRMMSGCIATCWRMRPTFFCWAPRCCRTGLRSLQGRLVMASLDHAMWFHQIPARG